MRVFDYSVHGEKSLGLRIYLVTLLRYGRPVRSWVRFSAVRAHLKGANAVRHAGRKWARGWVIGK